MASRQRSTATGLAAIGIGSVIAAQLAQRVLPSLAGSVIHDWLPAPLMLLTYWQAGQFFTRTNERLQLTRLRMDQVLFARLQCCLPRCTSGCATYFEVAYAFCYPLVPLGVGVLYLAHLGNYADRFWTVVLPPTYLCYAALPFLQTLPPRAIESQPEPSDSRNKARRLNLWVLRYASIQVNTLPSGHVAASFSAALALLPLVPAAGVAFIWMAISIAAGAVVGRYHYAVDVLSAAGIAVAVTLLEALLSWR